MYSVQDTAEAVGFPIRKSADQSLFAAPRGLSQRTTSFIASQRQGIHRMPLRHLIALIINTHPEDRRQTTDDGNYPLSVLCRPPSDGIDLKDQLASDRSDGVRSSSRQDKHPIRAPVRSLRSSVMLHDRCSERSYLFTISDIARMQ